MFPFSWNKDKKIDKNDILNCGWIEDKIEDKIKVLLADILEYDNVVNEFFLPVLKSKIDNPKEQLEKELKSLNNKRDRIRKAYIDELFTEEEFKQESDIIACT